MEELKNHLKDLGANFVITEEDLKSPEIVKVFLCSKNRELKHQRLLDGDGS